MNFLSVLSTVETSVFDAKSSGLTIPLMIPLVLAYFFALVFIFYMFTEVRYLRHEWPVIAFLLVTILIPSILSSIILTNENHPSRIVKNSDKAVIEILEDKYDVQIDYSKSILDLPVSLTKYSKSDGVILTDDPVRVIDSDGDSQKVQLEFTEDRKSVIASKLKTEELAPTSTD